MQHVTSCSLTAPLLLSHPQNAMSVQQDLWQYTRNCNYFHHYSIILQL